ncbi:MAG: hypothetical protein QMA92_02965, partial [Candidatus Pelagibacter bacterium]
MKRIIKILIILIITVAAIVIYLSNYGIKTEKFNNEIKKNVSKINKNINLSLNEVNYLLNPLNFSINISAKNPKILLEDKSLDLSDITTNISLKSFISNQFSIDDLKISTKEIQIKDLISLIRTIKGSPQLFVLESITKEGLISANIDLTFELDGKIKNDYQINGAVKEAKFNIFNQVEIENLNLLFDISKNQLTLRKVETELNNIEIEKINFKSINTFSFNVNKNLKLNDLKLETNLNIENFEIVKNPLNLKPFLPNYTKQVKLEDHKIKIKLTKDILDIKGEGDIYIG